MIEPMGEQGENWTAAENDLLVADYMDMLNDDISGKRVFKTARRQDLRQIGLGARSLKSIEAKQQNLSAILELLGYRHAIGLKPLPNYQEALSDALQRNEMFSRLDDLSASGISAPDISLLNLEKLFVPAPSADHTPLLPPRLAALVRKVDPAERDRQARELGKAGEAFVVDAERQRLIEAGRDDLIGDIEWVSDTQGDGHGYDIRSFDDEGREIHIEVKTTNGGSVTPFMLTSNEEQVSRRDGAWKLYRVHRFFREPQIFMLNPPIGKRAAMETAVWKVSPGRSPLA